MEVALGACSLYDFGHYSRHLDAQVPHYEVAIPVGMRSTDTASNTQTSSSISRLVYHCPDVIHQQPKVPRYLLSIAEDALLTHLSREIPNIAPSPVWLSMTWKPLPTQLEAPNKRLVLLVQIHPLPL